MALRLWSDMNNSLEWTALELLIELYRLDNIELVLNLLLTINRVAQRERIMNQK